MCKGGELVLKAPCRGCGGLKVVDCGVTKETLDDMTRAWNASRSAVRRVSDLDCVERAGGLVTPDELAEPAAQPQPPAAEAAQGAGGEGQEGNKGKRGR